MKICPSCNNEILPYLKTGELKEIKVNKLISYQCYFCVHCKIVYFEEHEIYNFVDFKKEEFKSKQLDKIRKEITDGSTKNS